METATAEVSQARFLQLGQRKSTKSVMRWHRHYVVLPPALASEGFH